MSKRFTCGDCPWAREWSDIAVYCEILPDDLHHNVETECSGRRVFRILRDEIRALNKVCEEQHEALKALMEQMGAEIC